MNPFMFRILRLLLVLLAVFTISALKAQDTDPNMGIVPAPVSVTKNTGSFVLSRETAILADTLDNKAVLFLADYLQNKTALRIAPKLYSGQNNANSIV